MGTDGTLRISSIDVTDAGTYTCTIKNTYGSDSVKYRVIVQGN